MRVRIVFDENVREDEPVYVISKAAELAGMHPQTLRQYDRLGLVSPRRTSGRGRRYSQRDVLQLVEIQRLSHEEGINLAGIKRILALENQVRALESRVEMLAAQANPGSRIFTAGTEGDVVSVRRKTLFQRKLKQHGGSGWSANASGSNKQGSTAGSAAGGGIAGSVVAGGVVGNGSGAFRRFGQPLQLTARVEEIDRAEFEQSAFGLSDRSGRASKVIELRHQDGSLAGGRALIVWTPDE